MDYLIRPLTNADEQVLWEMLYQALQTSEGVTSREILRRPEYARYVEGWGRTGDTGFVANDAKQKDEILGAVWLRFPAADVKKAEGRTPELALVVKPGLRKRGIGAALLTQLVKTYPHNTISIRAAANNPAVRLYERFGFKILQENPDALTMQRKAEG
jgi:ribosomal protein S18 acetylase RimI-like enzyme